jgi:hypothetical protein
VWWIFGQSLPEKDLFLSYEHLRKSDLFVVVGSSLVVTPAADMPREALRAGAQWVIINAGDTLFDSYAHLRFWEKIGEVLPPAVERLKILGKVPSGADVIVFIYPLEPDKDFIKRVIGVGGDTVRIVNKKL